MIINVFAQKWYTEYSLTFRIACIMHKYHDKTSVNLMWRFVLSWYLLFFFFCSYFAVVEQAPAEGGGAAKRAKAADGPVDVETAARGGTVRVIVYPATLSLAPPTFVRGTNDSSNQHLPNK